MSATGLLRDERRNPGCDQAIGYDEATEEEAWHWSSRGYVVVRSYPRAVDREHGLLLNFAKPTLEIKRVSTKRSF